MSAAAKRFTFGLYYLCFTFIAHSKPAQANCNRETPAKPISKGRNYFTNPPKQNGELRELSRSRTRRNKVQY